MAEPDSDAAALAAALRKPLPWQIDGLGIKGPQPTTSPVPDVDVNRRSDQLVGSVNRPFEPDPEPYAQSTVEQTPATADDNNYGFKMIDASDNEGPKVLLIDGYVNGMLVPGMGNDDFILPVGGDGYKIWVEVTYDTITLAITSLNINQGPTIPDSTYGDAYLLLGDVSIDDKDNLTPRNAQCGDINIAFIYGALNGAPAIYLLSQLDDPQPIS